MCTGNRRQTIVSPVSLCKFHSSVESIWIKEIKGEAINVAGFLKKYTS